MSSAETETSQQSQIEVYLIRHAESEMNVNLHLVGGRSNEVHLTESGVTQAQNLGQYLVAKSILPAKVYVSPAIRTIETANHVLSTMGLDIEPLIQEEIQELGQGAAEGKPRDEVYTPEVLRNIEQLGKDFKLEGGESMNEVGLRMQGWLTETFANEIPEEGTRRFFVFTHGGAIKYLASQLEDWDHSQTYRTEIENASISLFTYRNGRWTVDSLNQLPDSSTFSTSE
jgi:alpha-ribazole phosphatase